MHARFVGGLDAAGWVTGTERIDSPNFDARPSGTSIELAVIHGISLPPGEFGGRAIIDLFTNQLDYSAHAYYDGLRGLKVSAHFLVRRDGGLVQFVSCLSRAWHAGVSAWRGRGRCNDFSIGIELEGTDSIAYEDGQYATCSALIAMLTSAFPIQAIVGHSDIAPGRKTDPGPCFDWARLPRIT